MLAALQRQQVPRLATVSASLGPMPPGEVVGQLVALAPNLRRLTVHIAAAEDVLPHLARLSHLTQLTICPVWTDDGSGMFCTLDVSGLRCERVGAGRG